MIGDGWREKAYMSPTGQHFYKLQKSAMNSSLVAVRVVAQSAAHSWGLLPSAHASASVKENVRANHIYAWAKWSQIKKKYSTMTRLWFIEFYLKICNICEIVEVKKIVEEVTNYLDGIQHTAKIKNFVLAWNTFTIRQPIKPEQVCLLHWHWLLIDAD